MPGSLTCVGVGIQFGLHASPDARRHIVAADKVFCHVGDHATADWIANLNPSAESFHMLYELDEPRIGAYEHIVNRIMQQVRAGKTVCVVAYGHPGLFAYSTHEAIRRARAEGFPATMLPAISALDCLYADLGIDPGAHGCQCYEATDFLVRKRVFDPHSSLILLQVGLTGDLTYQHAYKLDGLRLLIEVLEQSYGAGHDVVIYEAAQFPVCDPIIQRVALSGVLAARISAVSTMLIPPKGPALLDKEMVNRLGLALTESQLQK